MRLPVQLLKRSPDTHKGDYGHALVLGGSPGLTGAVCLSAKAALKIGAGLVTVGIPSSLNKIFEIKLTEVMSLPLEDDKGCIALGAFKELQKYLNKIDNIILGPGASLKPATQSFIIKVLEKIDKPLVMDADAITALAQNLDVLNKRKTKSLVLTPHLGEFSRLVKLDVSEIKKKRKKLASEFALRYNLTLVLKGSHTVVTDGKKIFENDTGNPGMASVGSGDVLSGMIGGLISQKLDHFEAAKLGVYLHGLAADCAVKDKTQVCLIASDLIEYLPQAIKESYK